jgi:AI-2 transport protein TqsA
MDLTQVNRSTLVFVISVMFWGWVLRPLGMVLAVPFTMMLKVVLEGSEEFRWIGVAISSEPMKTASATRPLESPSPIPPASRRETTDLENRS